VRRFLPDSLTAWALLIVIAGLVVAEVATVGVILQNRALNARMSVFFHLAERVSSLSRAIAAEPVQSRAELAEALSTQTLAVTVGATPIASSKAASDDEIAELEDVLQTRLGDSGVTEVDVGRGPVVADPSAIPDPPGDDAGPVERFLSDIEQHYAFDDAYLVSVQLGNGSWANFTVPVAPSPRLWSDNAMILTMVVIALVLVGSIWALRRLTAPYAVFANAAERLGRDINAESLPEKGPREVRAAAQAFNMMQERLRRFIGDRDQLVAAISHDLRTPVTRLRLRAEFVEDADQRGRMLADLEDIEAMTRSVLVFASDSAQPEARESIDLISLLETLCSDMPDVTLALAPDLPPRVKCSAGPVGLRRAIANLIENAVKYGGGARVSLALDAAAIRIAVDDDGPGIPPDDMEVVFRPFRRLETSRNRETGGAGLGLTIARSVARSHGGDVILTNRSEGGLHAEIVLPFAAPEAVSALSAS
jgi:signal transduction histidine kinase